jgi:hypothetical protein
MTKMTNPPTAKYPLPIASRGFHFLRTNALPEVSVLEIRTDGDLVRVAFDKVQLEELSRAALIAASTIN